MSASDKKKLRKEQTQKPMTDRQKKEKSEAKKNKAYTITFVVCMVLVLAIALGVVGKQLVTRTGLDQRLTTAAVIGDHKITSAEMNYFYVDAINDQYSNWYSSYGNYTQLYLQMLYGLNTALPLSQQASSSNPQQTWADVFASRAVDNAESTYTLYDLAMKNGHQLTDEEKANLENSYKNLSNLASYYKYKNVNAYLKNVYGYGASEKTYRKYIEVNFIAQSYYNKYADDLSYTNEDFREYEKEHYDEFSSFSFASFKMNVNDFLPEGVKDENGNVTYTDEQRETAKKDAQAAVDALKDDQITSGVLLDKAIAQMKPYAGKDGKTSTKNQDVLYTNVAEQIRSWLADDARKPGDFTAIPVTTKSTDAEGKETETTTGYYLVVFEGRDDNTMHLVNVRHILSAFEGGTTGDDGLTTYTEAEKQAALNTMNEIKEAWLAGEKTQDSFAALAKEKSDDTNSAVNGGLIEDIFPGQTVKAFNDWCFDSSRKAGDYEVVETEYGYHLIYFVGNADMTYRDSMIESTLRVADLSAWYDNIMKDVEAKKVNTSHLLLDYIITPQSQY